MLRSPASTMWTMTLVLAEIYPEETNNFKAYNTATKFESIPALLYEPLSDCSNHLHRLCELWPWCSQRSTLKKLTTLKLVTLLRKFLDTMELEWRFLIVNDRCTLKSLKEEKERPAKGFLREEKIRAQTSSEASLLTVMRIIKYRRLVNIVEAFWRTALLSVLSSTAHSLSHFRSFAMMSGDAKLKPARITLA